MACLVFPIQTLTTVPNEGEAVIAHFQHWLFQGMNNTHLSSQSFARGKKKKKRMPESEWSASVVFCIFMLLKPQTIRILRVTPLGQ